MCKWNKWGDTRIDPCMRYFIQYLKDNLNDKEMKIVACCCGHKKYPMTIIVKFSYNKGQAFDIVSGKLIPRKRNFYKRDKQGYYFIPEVKEINKIDQETQ
jgi:hypothetical protein